MVGRPIERRIANHDAYRRHPFVTHDAQHALGGLFIAHVEQCLAPKPNDAAKQLGVSAPRSNANMKHFEHSSGDDADDTDHAHTIQHFDGRAGSAQRPILGSALDCSLIRGNMVKHG